MRVALIGGGWYGCHLAATLAHLGAKVRLFEAGDRLFSVASRYNQNRLHLGFHYARDYMTRLQSRDGYSRFLERYPQFSVNIPFNLYGVPEHQSLIDYRTYKAIMAATGIEFDELHSNPMEFDIRNIQGLMNTSERVVLNDTAAKYFSKLLCNVTEYGVRVGHEDVYVADDHATVFDQRFDYVIDTTWGHLFKPPFEIFYEATALFYYKLKAPLANGRWALTLVDGDLCSIYPTEDPEIYTLSSVRHTPLQRFDTSAAAMDFIGGGEHADLDARRRLMEEEMGYYVPAFRDLFEYVAPQISMKTKPIGKQDNRACTVNRRGRLLSVMSGKIDTIFEAAEIVLSQIATEPSIEDVSPIEAA